MAGENLTALPTLIWIGEHPFWTLLTLSLMLIDGAAGFGNGRCRAGNDHERDHRRFQPHKAAEHQPGKAKDQARYLRCGSVQWAAS